MLLITMLSLFSFSEISLDTGGLNIPYADKITHFIFHTVFVFLGSLAVRERTRGQIGIKKATIMILVLAIIYGIIIEVLQYTITMDRHAEFGDVLANTLGAFAGIILIRWLFSKEKPLKWKF
ncbi:VanZ family protein [Flagellimonas zhangzhouensis]|uniref:VanZ like family protein n=1 Tax=Flagellimonas zhangzhouensis TaxID=1073328 RepID=A0A1H2X1R8_9FLAO|nr:VanZ family protein [Allomuricauda zhangzhouensis]SDQ26512.1 VanZ like family protein [Allomuricauda zhangzhouensis]SDW86169.1 VanZ like family protein [Allomuricauda zhangzhouensis]